MMGTLIERPLIANNFKHKYPILLNMCNEELDLIKRMFDKQMALMNTSSGPVVHKNMPRVAGLLRWSQELSERMGLMMSKVKSLNHG